MSYCGWLRNPASVGGKHLLQKLVKCEFHGIFMGYSMDWFKGKSPGNHGFYHQI
jgi:hypothetical protein